MTGSLSNKERKRLQAILDQSYSDAFVNGSLAGGLGAGVLSAAIPATYGLNDLNPFRNNEQQAEVQRRNLQNIAGFGTGGFLLGAPVGGFINTARLMLQKRRARKLLGKTAAWNDYALHGTAGAGIGAGAGMLMNWSLGRKLFDKRLILGGALAGGGIGTAVGNIKSNERKGYEATQRTLNDCVQRDGQNNPILGANNLPLMNDGIYLVKITDAGIQGIPVAGKTQMARDLVGHQAVVIISSSNLNERFGPASYYTGKGETLKKHDVPMIQLANGQWGMVAELGVERKDPNGGKITDSHGNEWDMINTAVINDKFPGYVSGSMYDISSDAAYTDGNAWVANDLIRAAAGGKLPHTEFQAYKLTDDEQYNTPEMLHKASQSLVSHMLQRDGKLTPWAPGGPIISQIPRFFGFKGFAPATCIDYARWLINGLRSEGYLPDKFSESHFAEVGPIIGSTTWENAGVEAFGPWENTQDIIARQQRGEDDPLLTSQYVYEPYPLATKAREWIEGGISKLKDTFGTVPTTTSQE